MSFIKKLTTKLVYATLAAVIALSGAMSVGAYDGIARVTGNVVNIRSGAGTAHSIVAIVSKGDQLNIVSSGDYWTKVSLSNGAEGYIINDYITVEKQEGVVTGSVVNIRKSPSLEGEIIGLAYRGQTLPILGRENDWVNVNFSGQIGWISAQYISNAVAESIVNNQVAQVNLKGQQIADEAKKHVGKAYVYGASGPYSFDCSGLTSYVYKQFGYSINRTAAGQNSNGVAVSRENLQPGDIVLFYDRGYSSIGHAGIYIGNGQFVHANNSSTGVIITTLSESSYYSPRFVTGRRIVQ